MSSNKGRNFAIDVEAEEDFIIKVSGGSDPQSVASAITNAFYESNAVTMRALGAAAVNQAVKAIAIARGYIAPRGLDMTARLGFVNVPSSRSEGESVSAIVFRLSLS